MSTRQKNVFLVHRYGSTAIEASDLPSETALQQSESPEDVWWVENLGSQSWWNGGRWTAETIDKGTAAAAAAIEGEKWIEVEIMKMESSWFVRKQWSDYNCSANPDCSSPALILCGERERKDCLGVCIWQNHYKPQAIAFGRGGCFGWKQIHFFPHFAHFGRVGMGCLGWYAFDRAHWCW